MYHYLRSASYGVLLALLLPACQVKEVAPVVQLPEATQTGANTGGARVDGNVWVPASVFLGPTRTSAFVYRVNGLQKVSIRLSHDTDSKSDLFNGTSIYLSLPDVKGPGSFPLNQYANPLTPGRNPAHAYLNYSSPSPGRDFITGFVNTGEVVITRLDTVTHVIAGTFEFTGEQIGGTDRVQVTDGRFDLKF